MSMENIKINISAKIGEIDEDLKQKIINFTNALSELPKEPSVDICVLMNGTEYKSKENSLKINLSGLLTDQVLKHFNIHKHLGYGGTVVGKGTRISELADRMIKVKPNEQVAKLLKGEVVIPKESAHMANFKDSLRELNLRINTILDMACEHNADSHEYKMLMSLAEKLSNEKKRLLGATENNITPYEQKIMEITRLSIDKVRRGLEIMNERVKEYGYESLFHVCPDYRNGNAKTKHMLANEMAGTLNTPLFIAAMDAHKYCIDQFVHNLNTADTLKHWSK